VYELEAVIGEPHVLERVGEWVSLPHDMGLLPVTPEWLAKVADGAHSYRHPALGVRRLLASCSKVGPLAHVEAWFLGGDGGQAARVWRDGTVEWELDELEVTGPVDEWPINQALTRIGLVPDRGVDLFDELRLGQYRHTEKWFGPRER
jgi:hypothetical protein